MKKILLYVLIFLAFVLVLWIGHKNLFSYKFDQNLIHDYLRSQDIEDPKGEIKDRIFISDSDIYLASGYLYAKGENPTKYNFQHPPFVKYLFGFSVILTGNPYWIQMLFGIMFLLLTYFLSVKIFKNRWISLIPPILLLSDPLFGNILDGCYLDLGQAVFALVFIILALFYPKKWLWIGITLGFFAASKFWSTSIIYIMIVAAYKFVRKEKINTKNLVFTFGIAFIVFALIYAKTFIDLDWRFNIFTFLAKNLKFMMTHNSAGGFGGSIFLFVTGFFSPWWKGGIERAADWNILWPLGLISSIILAIKSKLKSPESIIYLLPTIYLLLIGTGVPFTRYFLIILPFIYISLIKLTVGFWKSNK